MIEGQLKIQCGALVLADGTAAGGICESLVISGTRVLQVEQFIRAVTVTVLDRGGKQVEVELTISQQLSSFISSLDTALNANDVTANVATLAISLQEGATLYTATLVNAGWRSVAPRIAGVSNVTKYVVVGGAFWSSSTPAASSALLIDGGVYGSAQTDIRDGGNAADAAADYILTLAGSNP